MISTPKRATWTIPALAVVLLLAFAASPAASSATQSDDRPPNATTDVKVTISKTMVDDADIKIIVSWQTRYPARSSTEARQAEDGTLDASWFRGEEELADFAAIYPDAEIRNSSTRIQHVDGGDRYGEVVVSAGTTPYIEFGPDRERIVIGPQLAEALSEGDELTVEIQENWTPETATAEGNREIGIGWKAYAWEIGEGPEPRFVLNESGVSDEPVGSDLGSGPIVAVVALALTVAILGTVTKWRGDERE